MSPFQKTAALAVGMSFTLGLLGCGSDGPRVVRVSGTLTHKGKPVPNAMLNFQPEKGRQTWAETDADGRFKINYDKHQDGIVAGKNKVWIEYKPKNQAEQEAIDIQGKAPPISAEMRSLFEKYNHANSKLEVNIESGTSNLEIKLD